MRQTIAFLATMKLHSERCNVAHTDCRWYRWCCRNATQIHSRNVHCCHHLTARRIEQSNRDKVRIATASAVLTKQQDTFASSVLHFTFFAITKYQPPTTIEYALLNDVEQ